MKKIIILLLCLSVTFSIFSQESDVGMGIGLSNQTIGGSSYQSVALMPELNLGFFGIGLNVDLRFSIKISGDTPSFAIYEKDWIIENGTFQDYLSLYLPKIAYIRLGNKNENFYLKAGQFSGATLGNGSILSDYSNMQFMPAKRLFGLAFDFDGNLFDFPYLGFESFVGNIAALDVIGLRGYVRPFKFLSVPVISNIEIGATRVMDRDPFFYDPLTAYDVKNEVTINGVDVTIPFIDTPIITVDVYSDLVYQRSVDIMKPDAFLAGVGGKIISLLNYRIQYIDQQKNYISNYFKASYDINRTGTNYQIYKGLSTSDMDIPAKKDMDAIFGFEIPKIVSFNAQVSGLLTLLAEKPTLSAKEAPQLYPSLKGTLHLDNELLKIVSADFFYLKEGLDKSMFIDSLIDPTNAVIGGNLSYYMGNMVISYIVDIKYNRDAKDNPATIPVNEAETEKWIINSQLAVNFKL